MKIQHSENRNATSRARRSLYHVTNHQEAGHFDTMTGATVWALTHVTDWNWRVEPSTNVHIV